MAQRQAMIWGTNFIDFDLTWYLSGPMAGYPEHNFPAFESTVTELRDAGLKMISPHEIEHPGLNGDPEEWAQYLANDLEVMIRDTQGIILMRGWPQSKGAGLELSTNIALRRPVFYYNNFLLTNMNSEG